MTSSQHLLQVQQVQQHQQAVGGTTTTAAQHPVTPMPIFLMESVGAIQDILGESPAASFGVAPPTSVSHHGSPVGVQPSSGKSQHSGGGSTIAGGSHHSASSSVFSPFLVKGPLYMRYDDRWVLCQVELTASRLKVAVHPEAQKLWSFRMESVGNASCSFANVSAGGGDTDSLARVRSGNTLGSVSRTSMMASPRPPVVPSPSRSGGFISPLQQQEFSSTSGGGSHLRSSDTGLSSGSRPSHNPLVMQHPLNRAIDVDAFREVKILHFLHYFDSFTFELVCKRSSKARSKFSHLSLPSHFSSSVNGALGDSTAGGSDRYEVLTFKAFDQKGLFQWIEGIEESTDPMIANIESRRGVIAEPIARGGLGGAQAAHVTPALNSAGGPVVRGSPDDTAPPEYPLELAVFGQLKPRFGSIQQQQAGSPLFSTTTNSLSPVSGHVVPKSVTSSSINTQGLSNGSSSQQQQHHRRQSNARH